MPRRSFYALALAALAFTQSAKASTLVGTESLQVPTGGITVTGTEFEFTTAPLVTGTTGVFIGGDSNGTLASLTPMAVSISEPAGTSITLSTPAILFTGTSDGSQNPYNFLGTVVIGGTTYEGGLSIAITNLTTSPSASLTVNAYIVPEPASIGLMGLGLVGVGALRLRRKRSV